MLWLRLICVARCVDGDADQCRGHLINGLGVSIANLRSAVAERYQWHELLLSFSTGYFSVLLIDFSSVLRYS